MMKYNYINKTDYTNLRCKCQDVFEYKNKIHKNMCINYNDNGFWCKTKDNCGYNDENKGFWDYCTPVSEYSEIIKTNLNFGNNHDSYNMIGLVIFISIVIIIFLILKKIDMIYALLFIANIDLLAVMIKYNYGPYNTRMFYLLYTNKGIIGYLSSMFINSIALITVFYIVLIHHKSLYKSLMIAFVTLFFTYVLPNQIIAYIQTKSHYYLYKNELKNHYYKFNIYKYLSILFIGLVIMLIIVTIEHYIIKLIIKN